MEMDDNTEIQKDEIEALSAIFGDDFIHENESGTSFSVNISQEIRLYVSLFGNYPSDGMPTYELQAPHLSKQQKNEIHLALKDIYLNHTGEPIIFEWIEKLKEIASNRNEHKQPEQEHRVEPVMENLIEFHIYHGEVITDRKSSFQGHTCKVHSQEEVQLVMAQLLRNRKIAQAKHNIMAYRIQLSDGRILHDCNDDGESGADSRLLHLLNILQLNNVIIVVTRWYGGIHIGPDRFRHINNAARDALVKANFIRK